MARNAGSQAPNQKLGVGPGNLCFEEPPSGLKHPEGLGSPETEPGSAAWPPASPSRVTPGEESAFQARLSLGPGEPRHAPTLLHPLAPQQNTPRGRWQAVLPGLTNATFYMTVLGKRRVLGLCLPSKREL